MTTFADMVTKPNAPDPKTEGVTGSARSVARPGANPAIRFPQASLGWLLSVSPRLRPVTRRGHNRQGVSAFHAARVSIMPKLT
jgi:hypothetical protein